MLKSFFKRGFSLFFFWLPDKAYCYLVFWAKFRRFPNVSNPGTLAEAMYWYKLHGGLQRFPDYVDKIEVRNFISRTIGQEYLNDIIEVYDDAESIKLDALPDRFVLKLNNGSGSNFIVTDKSKVRESKIRAMAREWLRSDYYRLTREPQYQAVRNRVFAEKFLDDGVRASLLDYKVYCFYGSVKMIQVISDRDQGVLRQAYYDSEWNRLEISRVGFPGGADVERPRKLDEMVGLAQALSKPFRFVRVDFYIVKDRIFFGELTFLPANGNLAFAPAQFDAELAHLMMA